MILITALWPQLLQAEYSWQKPHAEVVATGDLKWDPKPFVYQEGEVVRYIDYEGGDDANDGRTTSTPWRYHPWDDRATGAAAAHSGPTTYVFKRGVTYVCYKPPGAGNHQYYLKADESGEEGNPIRLTSSPDWGNGEAEIAGAVVIPGQWRETGPGDAPPRLHLSPDYTVWYIDTASWMPTWFAASEIYTQWNYINTMYEIHDGQTLDLHPARDPDWQEPGANFASDYWHAWDGSGSFAVLDNAGNPVLDDNGTPKTSRRPWAEQLKGFPHDYFVGGTIWSHYASFMGTPTPRIIKEGYYNSEAGALPMGHTAIARKGTRYFIENLPQYLDTTGEYYFDPDWNEATGRIWLRLPNDRNPNESQVAFGASHHALVIKDQSHIHVSGLTFTRSAFSDAFVTVLGDCDDIAITNNSFHHLGNKAIHMKSDGDETEPDDSPGVRDRMDRILVADNDFFEVKSRAIFIEGRGKSDTSKIWVAGGELEHASVLRNRIRNNGMRANDGPFSNVGAITLGYANTAEVAGNIIERSFGSGIVVRGGKEGNMDHAGYDIPLTRLLTHHNKLEHCALGVNDYGGLALWMGGPQYSYSNISGNAVGHVPGGMLQFPTVNLTYPLYLDGSFKIYNFNNILWQRRFNPDDPYTSTQAGYFGVFGFLNPFVNNTVVGSGIVFGGTSGNRSDLLGNLTADIGKKFFSSNHSGNPSLVGGGGGADAGSGTTGVATLAYANNIFHGPATAGILIDHSDSGTIRAATIAELAEQMQAFPLRDGRLGIDAGDSLPIAASLPDIESPSASMADFRPAPGSPAVDGGVTYFIPWSLYAPVGEWHFNKNMADPTLVTDYHYYMTPAYYHRYMFYHIPTFGLTVNGATTADYVASPSEDWTEGALIFDGTRHARYPHGAMADDIRIDLEGWNKALPAESSPWIVPEPSGVDENGKPVYTAGQVMTYPGELRKTLDIDTTNLLVEANLRVAPGNRGTILAKHDGLTGYRLYVNSAGRAQFLVSSGGVQASVATAQRVDDNSWHHVLAEIDRATGRMTIYLDGEQSGQATAGLAPSASLANNADFYAGCDSAENNHLVGAIDFMRICQGTLADARTDIEELYEWQTNGPARYDFVGNAPVGTRDVGALELVGEGEMPLPPYNVKAMHTLDGSVQLSWTDATAIETGYEIQRAADSEFTEAVTSFTAPADATSYLDTTAAGDFFHYRVRALGAGSPSAWSSRSYAGTQTLGYFEIDTVVPEEDIAHGMVTSANIDSLRLQAGPGVQNTIINYSHVYLAIGQWAAYNHETLAEAVAEQEYFVLRITPKPGTAVSLDSVFIRPKSFRNGVDDAAVTAMTVRSPLTGDTNLHTSEFPDDTQDIEATIDLSNVAALNNVAGPVELHFYFYGDAGTIAIDNADGYDLTVSGRTAFSDAPTNLTDAVHSLRCVAGMSPCPSAGGGADVNGDGRIGLAEPISALRREAGMQ